MNGDLGTAAEVAKNMRAEGFSLYIVRDVEVAKRYVRERYIDEK